MANAETFVLAGGRSSRMGQDKALLTLDQTSLLERALNKLRPLASAPPRIVGSRNDLSAYGEVIPDLHPGLGPLGGMEAALAASREALNLFLPVDLPLIPTGFLAWMLDRAHTTGALMTVPRINGRPQPLCAVYHRNLLEPIAAALLKGNLKVMSVITSAATQPQERDVFDVERVAPLLAYAPTPPYRWFHNCNTPEDMAALGNALVLTP